MKRAWQPGDVALVRPMYGDHPDVVAVRTGVPTNMGWAYSMDGPTGSSQTWSSDPDGLSVVRPLVVIDLSAKHTFTHSAGRTESESLISMLRETADEFFTPDAAALARKVADQIEAQTKPKSPKPDEPTGLGAVVEDADGHRWVRDEADGVGERSWYLRGRATVMKYAEIAAVRVLSEGVS